jgi:RND family efflux transporter MFP subunit
MNSFKLAHNRYRLLGYAALIALSLWLVFKLFFKPVPHAKPQAIVQAARVIAQPMPVIIQAPGTTESIQSVVVPAQVTGILKKISFQPGQTINQGQALFEIESASFQASLQQAQANLQRDQAQLLQNQADAKRYAALVKQEFVTRQQYEQAATVAKAQAALVKSDQAQVKQAEIQLSYTKISAPIAGKTGNLSLRVGDLITANSPLITINPLSPIWVDFTIPQQQLPRLMHYQQQSPLMVKVFTEDNKQLLGVGKLSFIDNTVNQQSGTVLVKAELPNSDQLLWPGQLLSAQLILTVEPKALTIPVGAIQLEQDGSFVYRVEHGKAKAQRVKIDRQINSLAVISEGLRLNDLVLTTIPPNFSEQEPITISSTIK